MSWHPIKDAPRDGQVLIIGHIEHGYVEYHARWGRHKNTGQMRWVDGHGNGLFDATHFQFPLQSPAVDASVASITDQLRLKRKHLVWASGDKFPAAMDNGSFFVHTAFTPPRLYEVVNWMWELRNINDIKEE